MALTPQNNEAFIREVDEELRRDQLASFGKRYGIALLVGIVLALAAFGGWLYWQHHQRTQQGEAGEQFSGALDQLASGQQAKAGSTLATLAKSDNDGYRALAKMTQADLALAKNDLKGASALFASIAGDAQAPQPLRDMALVRQTAAEFDTLPPQQVITRLQGLAVAGNPYLGSAGEMVAIAQLRAGRKAEAARLFSTIAKDDKVPQTIRSRAVQMAGVLGVDAVDQQEVAGERDGQAQ